MATPVPALPSSQASVTDLLAQLDKMIGGGKTSSTTTTTSSPDQGAVDQENLMLQKIFADINPDSLNAMVGNILERAKQTFGPAAISANAGGIRAYSDTVLESLRNEAMARATGEAVGAQLDAISKANNTAAGLVNTRVNASKQSTQSQSSRAGPSTLGQAAGLLTLGSAGMNIYKKLKDLYQPNAIADDQLASGGEGYINDAESYASADGGGITSVEGGAGGSGGVVADSGSGGASVVAPPTDSSGVMTDTSPFLSADAMEQQNTLAQQGLEGSGELSEVPALTSGLPTTEDLATLSTQADQGLAGAGELSEVPMLALPSEADMTVLNQQAAQAFDGAGELSQIPALGGGSLEDAVAALPGGEEMAALSSQAEEGLTGAGELSEVPALSPQPSPGAGAATQDLTSETIGAGAGATGTIDVASGAGSKILLDSGQTVTSQGASTVPGTDSLQFVSQGGGVDISALDAEANLGLEGAGELSEVPALTGSTGAAGATSAGTSGVAAAGGEEAAATGGDEAVASILGAGSIIPAAGIAAGAADVAANPQTNAITEALGGFTGFGGIIDSFSNFFDDDENPTHLAFDANGNMSVLGSGGSLIPTGPGGASGTSTMTEKE